jgi:branched-chain amino acid transport system ATP-binding protein
MLEIDHLNVFYGELHIIRDLSLTLAKDEIISVIGANGAGKSTLLNAIGGIIPSVSGSVKFLDREIQIIPAYHIVEMGLVQIPGERLLFAGMTVNENLLIGAWVVRDKKRRKENYDRVIEMFPILEERKNQKAGSLSGGEQQMLAIARGLMAGPTLLMLDEPSFGLAPKIVEEVFEIIGEINRRGVSILLVEQDVLKSLAISKRGYVLESGQIVLEGKGKELLDNEHVKKAYMGI